MKIEVLISEADNNDRNSRAIYWPGGEGDVIFSRTGDPADVTPSLDSGTLTLMQSPITTAPENADEKEYYKPHSTALTLTTPTNTRFFAGECFLFLQYKNSGGGDVFAANIATTTQEQRHLIDYATTSPVV